MLLSLVIPAFNEEATIPHLRKAFEDWRKTVNVRVELILVDDGSSDDTANIAEASGALVLRNAGNQGKGASLWRGMQAAVPHTDRLLAGNSLASLEELATILEEM